MQVCELSFSSNAVIMGWG